MEAGHSGASGRFRRLKEVAMAYTFVLAVSDRKCKDSAEPV